MSEVTKEIGEIDKRLQRLENSIALWQKEASIRRSVSRGGLRMQVQALDDEAARLRRSIRAARKLDEEAQREARARITHAWHRLRDFFYTTERIINQ